MTSTFDFEKELTKLGKSIQDFESFLEEDGESFDHFSEETVKKIYILPNNHKNASSFRAGMNCAF